MRGYVSIILALYVTAILSGCGSGNSTTEKSLPMDVNSGSRSNASKPGESAADEVDGPTIFGIDSQLQKEMRTLITAFIEQRQVPGDPAENLTKAFDSAMEKVRRPANEFGIKPDADGNLKWPDEFEKTIQSLRAEYEAKTFFESHKIDLPEWARPLLDEYNANRISPVRKELLFRLAIGNLMMDMT